MTEEMLSVTKKPLPHLLWRCPVCGGDLSVLPEEKRYACEKRHSFDIARQGYVNLLLPQKRGSQQPGDSPDMVRARSGFLEGGYYEGFSDGVNALCLDALRSENKYSAVLADAGCGEGYYTVRLCRALSENGISARFAGFDLARDAVLRGAKRANAAGYAKEVTFAAASLFEMPLQDASLDGVVNLFAPTSDAEFARVLRPGGFLLLAVPAEEHLWGFKAALYDHPYKNEVRRDILPHFTLSEIRRVSYDITLRTPEDIGNLFLMTPYYWKTSVSDREKLSRLETLPTEVSFDLLLYRRGKED